MFKREKKSNNADNFLLYVPKLKHTAWEKRNGKVLLIFYHSKTVEKFVRWLIKKPYVSDVELDDIGSATWQLIDGERTVFDIGEKLKEKYEDKCEPVYDRLIMYLRYLVRKGWVQLDRGKQVSSKQEINND